MQSRLGAQSSMARVMTALTEADWARIRALYQRSVARMVETNRSYFDANLLSPGRHAPTPSGAEQALSAPAESLANSRDSKPDGSHNRPYQNHQNCNERAGQ